MELVADADRALGDLDQTPQIHRRGEDDDPVLADGDVIAIESVVKQGFSWRDLFPVVAAVASVTLAVERLSNN